MCLAIPGKVVEVFEDHGLRMGRVDFGGGPQGSAWSTCPRPDSATTSSSTSASRSAWSTRRRPRAPSRCSRSSASSTSSKRRRRRREVPRRVPRRAASPPRSLAEIRRVATRPWTLMEVCGGQTHSIVKHGIDRLLPAEIELVHGPGCPVCVTPLEMIDNAHAIARRPGVIFTSFGDMLRVPGSRTDLLAAESRRAPTSASSTRRSTPSSSPRRTRTARWSSSPSASRPRRPPTRWPSTRARGARRQQLHRAGVARAGAAGDRGHPAGPGQPRAGVPRARPRLHRHGHSRIRGARRALPGAHRDHRLRAGRPARWRAAPCGSSRRARPRWRTSTRGWCGREGNPAARRLVGAVFEVCDRKWRGIGIIPKSGCGSAASYRELDAERRFEVEAMETRESAACISGQILRGLKKPPTARRSARPARRTTRSAPPWSRPRAPAPPTTRTGAHRERR